MTSHDRFRALIKSFLGPDGFLPAGVDDEFVIDADGPVQLKLSPEREEIAISTRVISAIGQPELIRSGDIAQFNAFHLFNGGYRLWVHTDAECIVVSQSKALARLEATGLSAFLEDFIPRCASCSRWYANQLPPLFPETPEVTTLA
jgi:hypothetical protein